MLSTHRVQLRPEFDLDAVAAVADDLAELGVSHLYCSPYPQTTAGSSHGDDVVDPSRYARYFDIDWVLGLGDDRDDTAIAPPAGGWWNQLTGEQITGGRQPLAGLLARFPRGAAVAGRMIPEARIWRIAQTQQLTTAL